MKSELRLTKALLMSFVLAVALTVLCGVLFLVFSPLNLMRNRTAVFTIFRDIAESQPSESAALSILNEMPYNKKADLHFWFYSKTQKNAGSSLPAPIARYIDNMNPSIDRTIYGSAAGRFGPFYVIFKSQKFDDYFVIQESKKGPYNAIKQHIADVSLIVISATIFLAFFVLLLLIQMQAVQFGQLLDILSGGSLAVEARGSFLDWLISSNQSFKNVAERMKTLVGSLRNVETERSAFVEQIAHDLRTPLTSLRTSAETLMTENLDKTSFNTLTSIILDDVNFLDRLTENLNGFSDLERKILELEPIELRTLTKSVFDKFHNTQIIDERKINWIFENGGSDELWIAANETQIRRLIINLIDNAKDFTNSQIVVGVGKEHEFVKLYVADDGSGLTQETRQRYGKRSGSRFSTTLHHDKRRTSLGLGSVIIAETAKAFGAQLTLTQRNNSGLCVELRFKPYR